MAGIEVIAGNFPIGRAEYGFGLLAFPKKPKQGFPNDVVVKPEEELLQVEISSEEEASRVAEAASVGLAGGLLLGPVGLLIGGLLGAADKKAKQITFIAKFSGNRQMLAKTDDKTYAKLQAIAFNNGITLAK